MLPDSDEDAHAVATGLSAAVRRTQGEDVPSRRQAAHRKFLALAQRSVLIRAPGQRSIGERAVLRVGCSSTQQNLGLRRNPRSVGWVADVHLRSVILQAKGV